MFEKGKLELSQREEGFVGLANIYLMICPELYVQD